jgi:hypothetical protein
MNIRFAIARVGSAQGTYVVVPNQHATLFASQHTQAMWKCDELFNLHFDQ